MNNLPAISNNSAWTFQLDRQRIVTFVKSTSTVAVLAAGILGSAALAYYRPQQWLMAASAVSLISLYSLPKILRHGNSWMIKTAMQVSLAALGPLSLGGSLVSSYVMGRSMLAAFQVYSATSILWTSFFCTGLIGYGIPASLEILNKAYSLLNHPYWNERFEYLKEQFNQFPEAGYGLLQANLLPNLLLSTALIFPSQLRALMGTFDIEPTPEILAATTGAMPPGGDQLKLILQMVEQLNMLNQMLPNSPDIQQQLIQARATINVRIKHSLDYLNAEELETAVNLLQDHISSLVPSWLTHEQFTALCQGPVLRVMNSKIDLFLDRMATLPALMQRRQQLVAALEQLEEAARQHQPSEREDLAQRADQLHHQLLQLRSEVEALYKAKQSWQNFFRTWGQADRHLLDRFSQIERLIQLTQDQPALQRFYEFYYALYEVNAGGGQTLFERIRRLSSTLRENDEEEPVQAWLFLGAERCDFRTRDYEDLCGWLGLNSLNDLEAKFDEIGLSVEADLYEKHILPRQGIISKEQIKQNLQNYIKEQLATQGSLRNRIYTALAQVKQVQVHVVSQKVTQALYRLITMGLILVPVCLHPIASAVGFSSGLVYFTLKKFEWGFTERMEGIVREGFHDWAMRYAVNVIDGRNFLSLTPQARENMEAFSQADLFGRFRLINFEIFATIMAAYAPDLILGSHNELGLGGFMQGAALAKEAVSLF